MARKIPNKTKTAVRNAQKGRCLCGVKSHFVYVDIAEEKFGVISQDDVVMLCKSCARHKNEEELRTAKKLGIIYVEPNTYASKKKVIIKSGQKIRRPVWHKYLIGFPQPQVTFKKVRVFGALYSAEDAEQIMMNFKDLMMEGAA